MDNCLNSFNSSGGGGRQHSGFLAADGRLWDQRQQRADPAVELEDRGVGEPGDQLAQREGQDQRWEASWWEGGGREGRTRVREDRTGGRRGRGG